KDVFLFNIDNFEEPIHTFNETQYIDMYNFSRGVFFIVKDRDKNIILYDMCNLKQPIYNFGKKTNVRLHQASDTFFVEVCEQDGTWNLYNINNLNEPLVNFGQVKGFEIEEAVGRVFIKVMDQGRNFTLYSMDNLNEPLVNFGQVKGFEIEEAVGRVFIKVMDQDRNGSLYSTDNLKEPLLDLGRVSHFEIEEAGDKVFIAVQKFEGICELYALTCFEFKPCIAEQGARLNIEDLQIAEIIRKTYEQIRSSLLKKVFLSNILHTQGIDERLVKSELGMYLFTHMTLKEIKEFKRICTMIDADNMQYLIASFTMSINDNRFALKLQEILEIQSQETRERELIGYLNLILPVQEPAIQYILNQKCEAGTLQRLTRDLIGGLNLQTIFRNASIVSKLATIIDIMDTKLVLDQMLRFAKNMFRLNYREIIEVVVDILSNTNLHQKELSKENIHSILCAL
ncbi:hypothetical protein ACFL4A_04630, partial [bacterium]